IFFFFSSRRRHTRWPRDWSSDVCSSDLLSRKRAQVCNSPSVRLNLTAEGLLQTWARLRDNEAAEKTRLQNMAPFFVLNPVREIRSEERRVGKESICGIGT